MPRPLLALLLAFLAAPASAAPVAARPVAAPPDDPAMARGDLVALRFAWPVPARAKVIYRRTRGRPGRPPGTFTARYEVLAEERDGVLFVSTRGTSWRGDLPFAPALAKDAIRATEQVVQRVRVEGEFVGLDGVEALRPVLARVLEDARIPPEQADRALALALAATRADAEELWNLTAGFWTGAELKLGETYAMESEGELPLLPGVRGGEGVEFALRRRVPCSAAEREPRCVEAVLRSTPDREALERAAPALLARLLPPGAAAPEDLATELSAGSELHLVTDPATLLPRRIVWTRAVRLAGADHGPPQAEHVDRSEWDYKWLPPEAPPAPRPKRRPAKMAVRAQP